MSTLRRISSYIKSLLDHFQLSIDIFAPIRPHNKDHHFDERAPLRPPTMIYTGACYCGQIKYELDLASPDDARTSICHCRNCQVRNRSPVSFSRSYLYSYCPSPFPLSPFHLSTDYL